MTLFRCLRERTLFDGLPQGVAWPPPRKLGALILTTLRENAQTDFDVDSAPGMGTRVTIKLGHKPPVKPSLV